MRTVPPGLAAHLAGAGTTTCSLLKIRPLTGAPFGITTLDRDVVYDDGLGDGVITYRAKAGYTSFDLDSKSDLSVDSSEAAGLLAQYPLDGVTRENIESGYYDGARYAQYLVNYEDLTQGHMILSSGFVGAIPITDESGVTIELRSLVQKLKQLTVVELTSITCRAEYGDERCKQPLYWFAATVGAVGSESDRTFTVDSDVGYTREIESSSLGTGDGTTTTIQLTDPDGASITADFAITSISVGDTVLDATAYSVSPTGLVTFANATASGMAIQWTGTAKSTIPADTSYDMSNIPFFTGDGTTYTAQLLDSAGDIVTSGFSVTEIEVDGDALDSSKYTVSSTGLVTFTGTDSSGNRTPPIDGSIVTWSGTLVAAPYGYWAPGIVKWLTGANAGAEREIETFDGVSRLDLLLPTYNPIAVGDTFLIRRDCDKSKAQCKAYGNFLNFRGEPEIPRADGISLQSPSS